MSLSPVVMLFARQPVEGEVKKRLAASVGDAEALRAHEVLVENVLSRLQALKRDDCLREIWIAGNPRAIALRAWSHAWDARLREQVGADLGAAMRHALHSHIRMGRRAVIVGSDVPPIDSHLVDSAFSGLRDHDVVLAPCEDGGYGLVGASKPVPELFADIDWGQGEVMAQTLRQAERFGYSVQLLDELWDVDDEADWRRFQRWQASAETG